MKSVKSLFEKTNQVKTKKNQTPNIDIFYSPCSRKNNFIKIHSKINFNIITTVHVYILFELLGKRLTKVSYFIKLSKYINNIGALYKLFYAV